MTATERLRARFDAALMPNYGTPPVALARGEGCRVWDVDGREYTDLIAGIAVSSLGHAHPAIIEAVTRQVRAIAHTSNLYMHEGEVALAERLLTLLAPSAPASPAGPAPGPGGAVGGRVFFTNSGAEAIESAIKFARAATKRSRIVYCDHGFHGLTTGALSLNGGREFRDGFGPLLSTTSVAFGDIDALARELRRGDVAAFVVEPIQGKGVNLAPDDYWTAAQALCRRHKTLFVMDEVQAGLGRTGKFFCHEHWGLQPDIVTVSKALSGGYIPVGAMLSSAKIFDSVFSSMDRAVVHSSTFSMNQLAMVAGLATLQAFDEEDIVDRARRTGEAFFKALDPLVERHEFLREVRGKGLMIGLVFDKPESRALRRRWTAIEAMRTALFSQLVVIPLYHRHGILTQVAADNTNVVKLLPPLVAGEEEVEYFVDALDDVLTAASRGSGLFWEVGRTMAKGALRRSPG